MVFLVSGGGSACLKALISGEDLAGLTRQLLACGADIVEMNTIRKRMSRVKAENLPSCVPRLRCMPLCSPTFWETPWT